MVAGISAQYFSERDLFTLITQYIRQKLCIKNKKGRRPRLAKLHKRLIGGFRASPGDTINNGEMNKCWWTNKAWGRLTSRQTREKLQCLYENVMSNNFCKMAVLK